MAKPLAKRPDLDSGRSDSFLRMLALEKQYRIQRIHEQVSATSANSASMDSFSSGASVVPLRVRRSGASPAGPIGSSQVPVQFSQQYKDIPLPELCISIPPPPKRPVAMATRDDIIRDAEVDETPPELLPRNPQRSTASEKDEQSKGVTFADFDDDGNASDQTSICYSPTWDTRKKKVKSPKLEAPTTDRNAGQPTSEKKKGKRLSKPPPTPGANVRSITKAERNNSAPRFDLEELESQTGLQKASKSKPPDAMKHPELHQKGNMSDSEKPKTKSFFSRIRRLSFDENMKSPRSPTETPTPPPVQKTHSSGPGAGLGFFSSRKTQGKEAFKANDRRSQSALDSRPPVSISSKPSSDKGRSNSLLAATLEKFKGSSKSQDAEKELAASQESQNSKAQDPAPEPKPRPSSTGRTTRFIESDDVLPIDTLPPAANFSKKPRSFSDSSRESADSRPTSKNTDNAPVSTMKDSEGPYKSPYSEDHVSSTDLSPVGHVKPSTSNFSLLSPGLTHLKNARSSEFETASIQESIFNVVNINERSSDYFDFITDSYTPPSLELGSSLSSRTPPVQSPSIPQPESNKSRVKVDKTGVDFNRKSREFPMINNSAKSTFAERRLKQEGASIASTIPAKQASSLHRADASHSSGSETPTPGSNILATPSMASPKNHSRTGSERSSSSLYDDSAPTPSTPATPDSIRPIKGQEKLPSVRINSSGSTARGDDEKRAVSSERQSRLNLRPTSQEGVRLKSDRSASIEPRTSEDSWKQAPLALDLDPPPAKFFGRADGNGSSSSLASSPTSIKSAKDEMTATINQQRTRDSEMPPRAQSAIDLSSTSFLPPLKHQPLVVKKNKRSSTAPVLASPLSDSADDEGSGSRPKATRSSTANGQDLATLSSSGAAYLEEARKSVQPASTGRGFRSPFSQKNSSSTSVKTTASGRSEQPIAKMLVECCGCKFYHDMPSKVYECMAKPDSIVEDRKLGVSAAVTTMVRCPWCGHGMSTQCCAGYAAVIFIKEKLHGK